MDYNDLNDAFKSMKDALTEKEREAVKAEVQAHFDVIDQIARDVPHFKIGAGGKEIATAVAEQAGSGNQRELIAGLQLCVWALDKGTLPSNVQVGDETLLEKVSRRVERHVACGYMYLIYYKEMCPGGLFGVVNLEQIKVLLRETPHDPKKEWSGVRSEFTKVGAINSRHDLKKSRALLRDMVGSPRLIEKDGGLEISNGKKDDTATMDAIDETPAPTQEASEEPKETAVEEVEREEVEDESVALRDDDLFELLPDIPYRTTLENAGITTLGKLVDNLETLNSFKGFGPKGCERVRTFLYEQSVVDLGGETYELLESLIFDEDESEGGQDESEGTQDEAHETEGEVSTPNTDKTTKREEADVEEGADVEEEATAEEDEQAPVTAFDEDLEEIEDPEAWAEGLLTNVSAEVEPSEGENAVTQQVSDGNTEAPAEEAPAEESAAEESAAEEAAGGELEQPQSPGGGNGKSSVTDPLGIEGGEITNSARMVSIPQSKLDELRRKVSELSALLQNIDPKRVGGDGAVGKPAGKDEYGGT